MKRSFRYKPSKLSAAMSLVVGVLFIIIGVTQVLPASFGSGFMGLFGFVWTGGALVITIANARYLFGKGDPSAFYGGFEITDEEPEQKLSSFRADSPDHQHITPTGLDAKARLEQLETLKEAGLLTQEEYTQKRQDILKGR